MPYVFVVQPGREEASGLGKSAVSWHAVLLGCLACLHNSECRVLCLVGGMRKGPAVYAGC